MRSPRFAVLFLMALAGFLPAAAGAQVANASGPSSGDYCETFIETGAQKCFTTLGEAKTFEQEAALKPLLTVFRDIGYKGGYHNFVSAYGRETCTSDLDPREASERDLHQLTWSNGGDLFHSISSFVILAGSGCRVTLYSQIGFGSGAFDRFYGSCDDLRVCALIDDWNDRAESLGVS